MRRGPGVGGGVPGGPHHGGRVCAVPGAELLYPRVDPLQGVDGPRLPRPSQHGHGEVLHPQGDLHEPARLWRRHHT